MVGTRHNMVGKLMNKDEKLKYEMRRDVINKAFHESRSAGFAKMEELGFCFAASIYQRKTG